MPHSQPLPGGFYDPQWPMQGPPPFDPSIPFDQFGQPIAVDQFGQPFNTGGFGPVGPVPPPMPVPPPQQPAPRPAPQPTPPLPQALPPARQQAPSQKPRASSPSTPSSPSKQSAQGASMRPAPSIPSDPRLVQKRAGIPFELGIASLVFGIVACLLSWAPVLGQYGLIIGGIGAIMGLIGIITALACRGRGVILGAAGAILCAVSIVVFFQMDAKYHEMSEGLAVNMESLGALSGLAASNESTSNTSDANASESSSNTTLPQTTTSIPGRFVDMAIGSSAVLDSGLSVTVDNVQTGLVNFDNTPVTCATVTYKNEGQNAQAYNMLDWLGEDANGAQAAATFYSEAENELGSGTLVAGGSVSGNVYFDGDLAKVVFRPTSAQDSEVISWAVQV